MRIHRIGQKLTVRVRRFIVKVAFSLHIIHILSKNESETVHPLKYYYINPLMVVLKSFITCKNAMHMCFRKITSLKKHACVLSDLWQLSMFYLSTFECTTSIGRKIY